VRQNARFTNIAGLCSILVAALFSAATFAQEVVPIGNVPENSPRESVRKAIFTDSLEKPSCQAIEAKAVVKFDAELDSFIKLIAKSIMERKETQLLALFHKRLNISHAAIGQVMTDMNNTYRAPFDVSVYRVWALNTVDGSTKSLDCDADRLKLYPLYGYTLQFGVWLQVMGQNELGRIYLSLVPTEDRWNIGSFHAQQWTHDSQDFATWAEEGVKNSQMGHKEAAFAKYDLAAKLLDGGGFIDIAMRDEIVNARDSVMTKDQWSASIKSAIKDWDVANVGTMLVTGGAGILVRIKIPKEISAVDVTTECLRLATAMIEHSWHAHLAGVRCNFVLPHEDPSKDGALGGVFLDFPTVRKKAGKEG